ncbi:YciI family protein [Arthrobacter sp. UYEF20]|uniref:YciI family protein n=1 Tax=Arthrobacter sp. UYEF20 TaxID=1756363 RepID=UPI00339305A4
MRLENAMQYMLLIYTDSTAPAIPDDDTSIVEWAAEVERRGISRGGDRLRSPSDSTTIKVRDGKLSVTDGPCLETKERIAGFDILECENLDEVIQIAAQHTMARYGQIEIRPFWPLNL